jgi:hypothetical protein
MGDREALVGACSDLDISHRTIRTYCCHGDKTAMTDKMFSSKGQDGKYREIEEEIEGLNEIIGSILDWGRGRGRVLSGGRWSEKIRVEDVDGD